MPRPFSLLRSLDSAFWVTASVKLINNSSSFNTIRLKEIETIASNVGPKTLTQYLVNCTASENHTWAYFPFYSCKRGQKSLAQLPLFCVNHKLFLNILSFSFKALPCTAKNNTEIIWL